MRCLKLLLQNECNFCLNNLFSSVLYFEINLWNLIYLNIFRENQGLHKIIGKLESELMTLKEKHEDLKLSKQDAVRDLSQLKDTHNNTVTHIKADLLNESTFREDVDRRLADVRAQVTNRIIIKITKINCISEKVIVRFIVAGTSTSRKCI